MEERGEVGTAVHRGWTTGTRLAFRFGFCYLTIFCVDLLADTFSLLVFLRNRKSFPLPFTAWLWHALIPWIGAHILRLKITGFSGGSGDTQYDWVLVLTELVIAAAGAAIWTALDRARREYGVLYAWLRIVVRTFLAMEMISYGLDKAIPMQFGTFLPLRTLATPVGELSPFRMLWTFMAASMAYTVFTGLVETAGGILLLIPELATLGAVISAMAMTNVFLLNMTYDVPVKLRSFHLLAMSLFLLIPEAPRLLHVFVLNRRAEPVTETPVSQRLWVKRVGRYGPMVFGGAMLVLFGVTGIGEYRERVKEQTGRRADYGVWKAKTFEVADATKPLMTEKLQKEWKLGPGEDRWKGLVLESTKVALVQLGNGQDDRVQLKDDAKTGETTVTDGDDPAWTCVLKFAKTAPGTLEMKGTIHGNAVKATFEREDKEGGYLLVTRGFHWVNERPF